MFKGWGWREEEEREEKLNVNGSGLSLGHPFGATGVRILAISCMSSRVAEASTDWMQCSTAAVRASRLFSSARER